jgi:Tfp pilus assembly protein FimT
MNRKGFITTELIVVLLIACLLALIISGNLLQRWCERSLSHRVAGLVSGR